jgi:hypothetical protein
MREQSVHTTSVQRLLGHYARFLFNSFFSFVILRCFYGSLHALNILRKEPYGPRKAGA